MKIKVPWFVDTDDQHVWVLCAFIRRLYIEYNIPTKFGVDMYLKDVKIILDIEHRDIAGYLNPHLNKNWGQVGRLEGNHYTFYPKAIMKHTKDVELTDPRTIRLWCYLAGCMNHNLIEGKPRSKMNKKGRPMYQAMNSMDRQFFRLSSRIDEEA